MSNFKCSECGMINIDCGKAGFKTPREIELETLVIELENRLKTLDEEAVTYQLTEKEYEEYKKLKVSSKQLEEENEATKAQRDTFANLMNVYKNISKGRQDSEIVIVYIDKLKQKLNIAEEVLQEYAELFVDEIGEIMIKDIMTVQEFIERNKTEDLCFELDDERLTDDINEFLEEQYSYYTDENLDSFCEIFKKVAVYTKYRFKLTSKFIFESIQDHLDDNFAFQDNIESLIGKSFFDNVCEEFNKRFETYTTHELIGFMDLSKELKEYIEKEVNK